MKLYDLFEDAPADITANNKANEIAHKFADWFMPLNEVTPLADIPGIRYGGNSQMKLAFFDAKTFGVDAPNLHIGFAWTREGAPTDLRGSMYRVRFDGNPETQYIVVNVLSKDSMNDVDLMYSVRWNTFIHELTHYFDFSRGTFDKSKYKLAGDYYNDPTELNAHFQQGLYEIMREISSKSERTQKTVSHALNGDFYDFLGWAKSHMPKSFHLELNDTNKKKFDRRLYKLWQYLRANQKQTEEPIEQ